MCHQRSFCASLSVICASPSVISCVTIGESVRHHRSFCASLSVMCASPSVLIDSDISPMGLPRDRTSAPPPLLYHFPSPLQRSPSAHSPTEPGSATELISRIVHSTHTTLVGSPVNPTTPTPTHPTCTGSRSHLPGGSEP